MLKYFRDARLTLLKQRRIASEDFSDQPSADEQLSRIKSMLKHVGSRLRNLRRDVILERIFWAT